MDRQVKIGLIGCGGIAGRHIQWLLRKPECEIAAVCDIADEAVQRRIEAIRELRPDATVAGMSAYEELVQRPDLDAVAVLLPHALHYPAIRSALAAGKHVLVEKPMVTSVEHARELIALAEARQKLIGIAYQRSYIPEYEYVRRMVENDELGTVRFVSAHLEQSWLAGLAGRKGSWRADPEQTGGGQLVDTGSHTLAAMLDVTGCSPAQVFAFQDRCGTRVDIDTVMAIRFREGALASVGIGGFGHSVTEVLRVVGDKASARIFFRTVREQSLEIDGESVEAGSAITPSDPCANFVDAILGRTAIRASADLGLRVAQLSEAAYESAATGKPVNVE